MGLRKDESERRIRDALAAWVLPIAVLSCAIIVAILGDAGRAWLSYDRQEIAAGEFWRLLSGHFVHLGATHLIWDAAGFLLIWYLVGQSFSRIQWIFVLLVTILGIDLGFWFLEPSLSWYVGLSGLVHGLLAAGIVGSLKFGRIDMWILGAALIAKLIYEALVGPLPGSEESSGGAVIVIAHVYGAIAGAIAAGVILIRVRIQAPI
jgi:rhomboid family GlyGly-CTERM serine protease